MSKSQTISLCMIVKNEENVLGRCLDSIKSFVNEIIIVDTGSTDRTIDIAKKYGAKIYHYTWDNDFGSARNFSIDKAKSKWILILDADEIINPQDAQRLNELTSGTNYDGFHFVIYNYMEDGDISNYTIHYAFRLFRNNGKYRFEGRIHEQIIEINNESLENKFFLSDLVIYHYGYLDNIKSSKNKRERNIPIIQLQLDEDPQNAFHLFNMGNEYMAQNMYREALQYYIRAYENKEVNQAYCPHLMYRIILCLIEIKEYNRALTMANESLTLYPKCTDIEFCKALVYKKTNAYILAINSLNRCIEMGEPPTGCNFVNGCGTFRAFLELGDIYMTNQSYMQAVQSYNQVLNHNPKAIFVLYKIGRALNKVILDKELIVEKLTSYFNDILHIPNRILLLDILIQERLYEQAEIVIEYTDSEKIIFYKEDFLYLKSKLHFYQNKYKQARINIEEYLTQKYQCKILKRKQTEVRLMYFTLMLIIDKTDNSFLSDYVKSFEEITEGYQVDLVFQILEMLLRVNEFEIFEHSLEVLNRMESSNVLLRLAKLYYQYDFKELAIKTIYQSICEFNLLDVDTSFILSKEVN